MSGGGVKGGRGKCQKTSCDLWTSLIKLFNKYDAVNDCSRNLVTTNLCAK